LHLFDSFLTTLYSIPCTFVLESSIIQIDAPHLCNAKTVNSLRPFAIYILMVLGASILISCKHELATEAPDTSALPEVRGIPLTTQREVGSLVWPKNSTALFYCNGSGIKGVDVQTKTIRPVFESSVSGVSFLVLSPDQQWLYFMVGDKFVDPDALGVMYRIPTTEPFVPQRIMSRDLLPYSVSPDNIHVAYGVRDSLCIFDIEKQTKKVVSMKAPGDSSTMEVGPSVFSPDGETIFFRITWSQQYSITTEWKWCFFSLETGSVQPCDGLPLFLQLLQWDEAGPRALWVSGFGHRSLYVANISASTSTCIGQATGNWSMDPGDAYAWSLDGKKVAYRDWRTLSYEGFHVKSFECCLRVINIPEKRTDLIARGNTPGDIPGDIAFSGDGSLVAYTFGDRIYMTAIP
jgi:hypothetical protein